jgi:uncharacterized protein with PQ loop repeat
MVGLGVLSAFSSLPQVIQNYKTHSASGVSLITYIISIITIISWLAYGMYIKNKPLIYTSTVSSAINLIVIVQIILY